MTAFARPCTGSSMLSGPRAVFRPVCFFSGNPDQEVRMSAVVPGKRRGAEISAHHGGRPSARDVPADLQVSLPAISVLPPSLRCTMSDFDPVILIHGAWQGSWAWGALYALPAGCGLTAQAIDLPGNGVDGSDPADVTFEACLQHLYGVVRALGRPVSLVGHSGGGLLVTAFAERWPRSGVAHGVCGSG